jgi:uncharacterized membrane protein
MAIKYAEGKTTSSAKTKVLIAALTGVVVALVSAASLNWRQATLMGWDTAGLLFIMWIWLTVWPMSGKDSAGHALREDPSRAAADILLLVASIASLASITLVLVGAADLHGSARIAQIALGVASVVVSWTVLHTVYALKYAEMYFHESPGGVDFPGNDEPSYKDFAYLAFTMGMTFQVSDTGFQSTEFRATALRHALVSYLFGTVIVATTINLIAGLTS